MLALFVGLLVSLIATFTVVRHMELDLFVKLRRIASDRLVLYSGGLRSALDKYRYLPHMMATHPDIVRLVTRGDNQDQINRYLENINAVSGSMALFVLNKEGMAIATSNWNEKGSFAGQFYNYRPYYLDAMNKGIGGYYGVGATTGNPGYFFTKRITVGGGSVGVAVTKVDLKPLQRQWHESGETVFITDEHGIIFLSSREEWLYRASRVLDTSVTNAILYQRQYGSELPRTIELDRRRKGDMGLLSIGGQNWIYTTQSLPEFGWTLWYLTSSTVLRQQVEHLWLMGIGVVFMLLLLLLLARLAFAWAGARRSAREAEKIRRVNNRLASEIRIRKRTEKELRAAQVDLLHAGRLAALGQVAASVAHELSQPVTSMQMFAASCRRFARSGDCERVEQTVEHLLSLVQRLKKLIGQLKHFSRKGPEKTGPVPLALAIQNALTILEHQQEYAACTPTVHCPPGLAVTGDSVRIEQVLINLVQNALDAVSGLPPDTERRVAIKVRTEEGSVLLSVSDNGPGIASALEESLFAPFVTSKKSGEGIGLGLAIADSIVHALRGSITAHNRPEGGACFTVQLPRD